MSSFTGRTSAFLRVDLQSGSRSHLGGGGAQVQLAIEAVRACGPRRLGRPPGGRPKFGGGTDSDEWEAAVGGSVQPAVSMHPPSYPSLSRPSLSAPMLHRCPQFRSVFRSLHPSQPSLLCGQVSILVLVRSIRRDFLPPSLTLFTFADPHTSRFLPVFDHTFQADCTQANLIRRRVASLAKVALSVGFFHVFTTVLVAAVLLFNTGARQAQA